MHLKLEGLKGVPERLKYVGLVVALGAALARPSLAVEHRLPYGDIDGDGRIAVSDVQRLLKDSLLAGAYDPRADLFPCPPNSAVCGDGATDLRDAIALLRASLGLVPAPVSVVEATLELEDPAMKERGFDPHDPVKMVYRLVNKGRYPFPLARLSAGGLTADIVREGTFPAAHWVEPVQTESPDAALAPGDSFAAHLAWDQRDLNGNWATPETYIVRVRLSDGPPLEGAPLDFFVIALF